jgi:hypothetical protein
MLRARTAITCVATLVLGMASAFTVAIPANAQTTAETTVINVHYDACLSELGDTAGTNIGLDSTCSLSAVPASDSEDWYLTQIDGNTYEIENAHSGKCLTEDELEVGVGTCNANDGADLWETANLEEPNGMFAWQLENVHYEAVGQDLCLGSNSVGLGGTGASTCSSNHADYWYLPTGP